LTIHSLLASHQHQSLSIAQVARSTTGTAILFGGFVACLLACRCIEVFLIYIRRSHYYMRDDAKKSNSSSKFSGHKQASEQAAAGMHEISI